MVPIQQMNDSKKKQLLDSQSVKVKSNYSSSLYTYIQIYIHTIRSRLRSQRDFLSKTFRT